MRNRFKKILSLIMITIICTQFISIPQKAQAATMEDGIMGEIRLFAGNYAPKGWALCNGQILNINSYQALFSILGTMYGGNGMQTFALPNLNNRVTIGAGWGTGLSSRNLGQVGGYKDVTLTPQGLPAHNHGTQLKLDVLDSTATVKVNSGKGTTQIPGANTLLASGLRNERVYSDNFAAGNVNMKENSLTVNASKAFTLNTSVSGGGATHNNMSPYLALNYIICIEGTYPSRNGDIDRDDTSFTGEIKMFASNFAPVGWRLCNGSSLPISEFPELYSLIGTTYGKLGETNFNLPDLQGRAPLGAGQGPGLSNYTLGQAGGAETVTLTANEIPSHTHTISQYTANLNLSGDILVSESIGNKASPEDSVLAVGSRNERIYTSAASNGTMKQDSLSMNLSFSEATASVSSTTSGMSLPHENMMPYAAINYIINVRGADPSKTDYTTEPNYLGFIEMYAFDFAPIGRALCNGQELSVSSNESLFSILGTKYGGNGITAFALPDTRSRMVIGKGDQFALGEKGGEEKHTLTLNEIPAHTHRFDKSATITGSGTLIGTNSPGSKISPLNSVFSRGYKNERIYSSTSNKTMTGVIDISANISITPIDSNGNPIAYIDSIGGGQSHDNMMPYTVINFAIVTVGAYPPPN